MRRLVLVVALGVAACGDAGAREEAAPAATSRSVDVAADSAEPPGTGTGTGTGTGDPRHEEAVRAAPVVAAPTDSVAALPPAPEAEAWPSC